MKQAFLILLFTLLLIIISGCRPTKIIRNIEKPENYVKGYKDDFLKIHMKDGSLYVLDSWKIKNLSRLISGTGKYYNYKRDIISSSQKKDHSTGNKLYNISWDDITLLETNQLKYHSGNLTTITIVGVPMALLTIYCLTNPKACFGSCPTFYTRKDEKWKLAAEGFSSSILPVFEKGDIDMLYWSDNINDSITIKLTNEALETHVIRFADLLIFPHIEKERVFYGTDGNFYRLRNIVPPSRCICQEGSCREEIKQIDHKERFSLANPKNLAKKEEIIFSFTNEVNDSLGLIITSRQTLLTTFLFYQGLAYSGNYAGYFAARIENGNKFLRNRVEKLWNKLGGIEIYLKLETGKWEKVGEIDEMGPIASDLHVIKLPPDIPDNSILKLKMTQGLWRIDYLALGEIISKETPVTIHPESITRAEKNDNNALRLLNDTTQYLVTYPGDNYFLNYKLPDKNKYEYFLNSKGYYLEWIRDEWLAEQDLQKLRFMFAFPGSFMRKTAKEFKKIEPSMEESFWGSRYVQE